MGTMIFFVLVIFFALLGIVNLLTAVGRWLGDSCPLCGCKLLVQPGADAEHAEALLLAAWELLNYDPRLHDISLAVVCPTTAAARVVAEHFCADRGLVLFSSLAELDSQ